MTQSRWLIPLSWLGAVALGAAGTVATGALMPSSLAWSTPTVHESPGERGEGAVAIADLSAAFRDAADAVRPAVVSILSREGSSEEPGRRRWSTRSDFGSGVLVRRRGDRAWILTNAHVVKNADSCWVDQADGRRLRGSVVGRSSDFDLAVVAVEGKDLRAATLGDSDRLEVGDWVLAVGSPFALQQTVTAGIISHEGRSGLNIAEFEDFLQTDAAIHPGNSGGPLVDLEGRVIGINTAITSEVSAGVGIGFAIPINTARMVMETLIEHGRVVRGMLGVQIMDLDAVLAQEHDFEGTLGVLVAEVHPGAARQAGVEVDDIIIAYDGRSMQRMSQLRSAVAATPPGSRVDVTLYRGGRLLELPLRIGSIPEQTSN